MKRILILIIGLIGVAYGQSSPTSAKTRFVNGIYLGTKLDSYFAAADSNAIYWRADSALMAKYKGTARALAFAVSGGYLPISDTAAMLSPYLRRTDSTGLLSQVVRTFGTQTIGGDKTFSNDIVVNGLTVGRGGGNSATNTAVGASALSASTTGLGNTVLGANSLDALTTGEDNTAIGYNVLGTTTGAVGNTAIGSNSMINTTTGNLNTAVGVQSLQGITSGGFNVGAGGRALIYNTTGSNNIAIGYSAGETISGGASNTIANTSIFIGRDTKAAADNQFNQIVIGHDVTGNGSNTVTIGNSSITNNYFTGNIRGGAFIKSGGTSSQFLKADGSVDGTSYATAASSGGYVDLTSAQTVGGLKTFTSDLVSTGIQTNAYKTTSGFTSISLNPTTADITLNYALSGTSLSMSGGANLATSSGSVAIGTASAATYKLDVVGADGDGIVYRTSTRSIGIGSVSTQPALFWGSGTPLTFFSGSELGRFASDGTFLINTTTTDGTNKLIVNGGVKFGTGGTATITASGAATFSSSVTAANRTVLSGGVLYDGTGGNNIGIAFGSIGLLSTDGTGALAVKNFGSSSFRWGGIYAQTGDFSSSVTANSFVKSGGTSSQALMADGSVQTVTSATYTPTLAGVTNINSVTLDKASYTRVGSIITVYVNGTVSTTASGGSVFSITAPLQPIGASVIGNGTVNNGTSDGASGYVSASSTSVVNFNWNSINTTSRTFSLSFQYSL